MKNISVKSLGLFLALALLHSWAAAQDLEFRAPANANDASANATMRDLAVRILPVYQERNPEKYLSNLSALQMVAEDYKSAYASRQSLRERQRNAPVCRALVYDIYARARNIEAESRIPFTQAFTLSYRNAVPRLDDLKAYELNTCLSTPFSVVQEGVQRAFDQRRAKGSVPLAEAMDLIWAYLAFEAYRSFSALVGPLNAEDDRKRYLVENVQIKTAAGVSLSAMLFRPKSTLNRLPTLLELTIYDSPGDAKESAAHGYVGMVAYARGVRGSAGKIVPFEHEATDARAVVEWITKQPWSNGRVGLYGSGYSGFAAWAAARRLPPAVKAIATSDPMGPGIDVPMRGNIFLSSAYRWAYQVTNTQRPGDKTFEDDAQWRAFTREWYTSGRSFREFAGSSDPHSVLFRRWLSHPSYDRFWQRMIPSQEELARIEIPVLTITGYFSDGVPGSLHYLTQQYQANARANHTLLIGPWDENAMQRGVPPALKGYPLDPAAVVDLRELRYQWLNHVLKGEPKPGLLTDRINYQTMGTNEWRHAPSLEAMAGSSLRFYLEPTPTAETNRLTQTKSAGNTFLPQTFDFENREDVNAMLPSDLVIRQLDIKTGEIFVSEPLQQPVEMSGLLSGKLDFTTNKMDMDLVIALYELLPNGEYVKLFDPSYEFRASYARDRVRRRLLRAGERQQLPFRSEALTSRRLQAGSRVVMVLGINKRPDRQINYGTGGAVSDETIADARVPLRIRWYSSSYIDLPVRK